MVTRRPLVAANWKMNGSLATIRPLLQSVKQGIQLLTGLDVAICAPSIYMSEVRSQLVDSAIALGAQNVSEHDSGAYTGEISAAMLTDLECRYVIVGHSERRTLYHDTDQVVAKKFVNVCAQGQIPILCVGEQLRDREAGVTEEVIARQLGEVINKAGIDLFANAVIAYEPVWAIGTGRTATPEQAEEVHGFIRLQLARHADAIADKIRILYGGSVKADNARDLFSRPDIDGGLIGGASLVAADFLAICQATR